MADLSPGRREQLEALSIKGLACEKCDLSQSRTQVVFGAGNPDAELMFVGEAPGAEEDIKGTPFVGRSGKLLDRFLEESGISRADVFITSTLKCRPPANRDPRVNEIQSCQPWLFEQIRLIEPRVVATLGNFATRLLSGSPAGITQVHGQPQTQMLGQSSVLLFPLFHPAAALRSTRTAELFRQDLQALSALLAEDRIELGIGEPQ